MGIVGVVLVVVVVGPGPVQPHQRLRFLLERQGAALVAMTAVAVVAVMVTVVMMVTVVVPVAVFF